MSRLERPAVRWAIALAFLGVKLLLLIAVAELFWVAQLVLVLATVVLSAVLPSILREFSAKGTAPIESTQRRRAAWVRGVVDTAAAVVRIDRVAPIVSWIAPAVLGAVAVGIYRAML